MKKLQLQIVGTINAYQALQATKVGYKSNLPSGGGIANAILWFHQI